MKCIRCKAELIGFRENYIKVCMKCESKKEDDVMRCPRCSSKTFTVEEQAFQRLDFDANGEPDWGEIEAGDRTDKVFCRDCGYEIPEQVWSSISDLHT